MKRKSEYGSIGPSKRHIWEVKSQNVDRCKRCGKTFHHLLGGNAAFYCFPTEDWMTAHVNDDGETY